MAKLVGIVLTRDGQITRPYLESLAEARRQADANGHTVTALVIGAGAANAASTLGQAGSDEVVAFTHSSLSNYNLEAYGSLLADQIQTIAPAVVLAPATVHGRELAPWIAARLQTGYAADVTSVSIAADGQATVKRPMYAGKVHSTVECGAIHPQVITLRPNIFPIASVAKAGTVTQVDSAPPADLKTTLVRVEQPEGGKVELSGAKVIVSGGRGLQGPENFKLLDDLASVLGAAVGATRMVVDLGWVDHSMQVGQTGKVVNPDLYIAVGISGAIQHLVGMQTSKCIVAINKDPEANIFKVADYGLVGDVFEILPKLTESLRKVSV